MLTKIMQRTQRKLEVAEEDRFKLLNFSLALAYKIGGLLNVTQLIGLNLID